jgi:hypothetical protein
MQTTSPPKLPMPNCPTIPTAGAQRPVHPFGAARQFAVEQTSDDDATNEFPMEPFVLNHQKASPEQQQSECQ